MPWDYLGNLRGPQGEIGNLTQRSLVAGEDTRTLVENGIYDFTYAVAQTLLGFPPLPNAGQLFVREGAAAGQVVHELQFANGFNEPRSLTRSGTSAGVNGPWVSTSNIPETLPNGSVITDLIMPGVYGTHNATIAASIVGIPESINAQPFSLSVATSWSSTTNYRCTQEITVYPYAAGQIPRTFKQHINSGSAGGWVEVMLDEPERSPHHRQLLLERSRTRHGGKRGTAGKGVVVLSFDHGFANFRDKLLQPLVDRQLRATLVVNTASLNAGESAGVTYSTLRGWAVDYGFELANHSRDHGDAIADTLIRDKILGSLDLLHTNIPEVTIDGYVMPGVSGAGYKGFNSGTPLDKWWSHIAGRTILDNHAVVTSVTPGYLVPLSGEPVTTMMRLGVDRSSFATLATSLATKAGETGSLLHIYGHPSLLDLTDQVTTARWIQLLDHLVALRDAGKIEVLTMSGGAWADAGSSYVMDLVKGASWTATGTNQTTELDLVQEFSWARGSTFEVVAEDPDDDGVVITVFDDTGLLNTSVTKAAGAGGVARLGFTIPSTASTLTVNVSGAGTASVTAI